MNSTDPGRRGRLTENERFAVTLTAGEGYRFDVDFDLPGWIRCGWTSRRPSGKRTVPTPRGSWRRWETV